MTLSNIHQTFHTLSIWDVDCTEMYNLAKDVGSGNVVMAIPKVYANVSVEAMEYIFQSDYIKKGQQSWLWGCNSTSQFKIIKPLHRYKDFGTGNIFW